MDAEINAIAMLEKWNRKHYRFSISSNGNYMPGDGVAVELSAAGRKVVVCEDDLIRHDEDYYPTIGELIIEALRQWHADTTMKKYDVYFTCREVAGTGEITVTRREVSRRAEETLAELLEVLK